MRQMQIEELESFIVNFILKNNGFSLKSIKQEVAPLTFNNVTSHDLKDIILEQLYTLMKLSKISKYEYQKVQGVFIFKYEVI